MTQQNKRPKPIVLTALDGWRYPAATTGNAIALARKPNYDRLLKEFPNTLIHTSGPAVGLPEGQMGNSEVGHLNLGAGRIVNQELQRINVAVRDGSFGRNAALLAAIRGARTAGRPLHLLGLVSDGGVHSHIRHLMAITDICAKEGLTDVYVH